MASVPSRRRVRRKRELSRKPKKIAVRNVLKFSSADSYEEAQGEWSLLEVIDSTSKNFTNHCELCNNILHVENWVIQNTNNWKVIRVGSDCIRRFIIIEGTGSAEGTAKFMDNMEQEWSDIQELRLTYKNIVVNEEPTAREVRRFHKKLTQILEKRGMYPLRDDFTIKDLEPIIIDIFKFTRENYPPLTEQWKLYQILYDVSKIKMKKDTRKIYNPKFKEHETFRRTKVTGSTLAGSRAYSNPANKYN